MFWLIDTFEKEPSLPIFNDLKILKIQDIFKIETLKFVYDSLKKFNPSQFHEYFQYSVNVHNTAATRKGNLNTPQVRTVTYGTKSIKFTGCTIWNSLPDNVRNAPSKKTFSKLAKKYFINSYTV